MTLGSQGLATIAYWIFLRYLAALPPGDYMSALTIFLTDFFLEPPPFQCNCLTGESFDEDLHATSRMEDKV